MLFHELLGLLKPFFSVLFNALSEKQEIVISLSEQFLEEVKNEDSLS